LIFANLKGLTILDPLTGLYNRLGFNEFMKKKMSLVPRGEKTGILLMDLDNFKNVNDQYGHLQGDLVLKSFSQILINSVRKSDIVCRLGGDEFVVVFSADRESIDLMKQRIRENMRQWVASDTKNEGLDVSIGSAVCETDQPCDIYDLIHIADMEMYQEKEEKKCRKCNDFNVCTKKIAEYKKYARPPVDRAL